MDNIKKIILSVISMFFLIISPILQSQLLLLLAINLLFYIIFTSIKENSFSESIGTLFILSALLLSINFILPLNLQNTQIFLYNASTVLTLVSLVLFFIYYLIELIKKILQSIGIEIKTKK